MTTKKFSSLGLVLDFSVPATVEEFDQNAKRAGACLDEAINNVVYRSSLAEFREIFIHGRAAEGDNPAIQGLEEITGIERLTKDSGRSKTEKDASGADVKVPVLAFAETEADYVNRVCAEKGWTSPELRAANLKSIAEAIATAVTFDASASERKPAGPKKLPQMYTDAATRVYTKGTQDNAVALIGSDTGVTITLAPEPTTDDPTFAAVRAKNVETLGWAIKAHADWKRAKDLAQF